MENQFVRVCKIIYLCILCFNIVQCGQDVGDLCVLKSTGEQGACELISNCHSAQLKIKTVEVPQLCGFSGIIPIVCCVDNTSTTISTDRTVVSSQLSKKPEVGAKSKAKCEEYGRYVYENGSVDSLTDAVHLRDSCVIHSMPLIVGGSAAIPGEFPHMAAIGFLDRDNISKSWLCGGSLISDQFVLTAAHCVYSREFGAAKYIRLGDLDLESDTDDAKRQEFEIVRLFRHPDFKPPAVYNDIALLQIDRKAELNPYVRPACLNVQKDLPKNALVSAWGGDYLESDARNVLRKHWYEYFTHTECKDAYFRDGFGTRRLKNGIDEKTQICAGSRSGNKDTCLSSGGPLMDYNRDVYCTYSIVGVTSFGKSCAAPNTLDVYTNVSAFVEWIESIVWP